MSNWTFLNKHRKWYLDFPPDPKNGFNGLFQFNLPGEARLVNCVASDGMGWQHVSVSYPASPKKAPSWEIMCQVKDLFWEAEDAVIQIHPPRSQWVNNHPGCLHLWRCTDGREQPLPITQLIGVLGLERAPTMKEIEADFAKVKVP